MRDTERRRYEMFLRVREFMAGRATQFPPTSLAGELAERLNTVIEDLDRHTTTQSSGRSATRASSASKAAARDELRRDLEAISRTARVMTFNTPGLEDKFRVPRNVSDQTLIAAARAFAGDALPLKTEFTRRGLPEDFLDDLNSDIAEFEQAINQKIQKQESHVAATAAIDSALEHGLTAVRELDAIMRNTLANNAASLAAWLSASHTERSPRRAVGSPPAA
jgi:hypothetical protein